MAGYVVIAGYVTVETAVPGGRARIDIAAGEPVPDDVPDEDVGLLLARGQIAPVPDDLDPEPDPAPKRSPKRTAR